MRKWKQQALQTLTSSVNRALSTQRPFRPRQMLAASARQPDCPAASGSHRHTAAERKCRVRGRAWNSRCPAFRAPEGDKEPTKPSHVTPPVLGDAQSGTRGKSPWRGGGRGGSPGPPAALALGDCSTPLPHPADGFTSAP